MNVKRMEEAVNLADQGNLDGWAEEYGPELVQTLRECLSRMLVLWSASEQLIMISKNMCEYIGNAAEGIKETDPLDIQSHMLTNKAVHLGSVVALVKIVKAIEEAGGMENPFGGTPAETEATEAVLEESDEPVN